MNTLEKIEQLKKEIESDENRSLSLELLDGIEADIKLTLHLYDTIGKGHDDLIEKISNTQKTLKSLNEKSEDFAMKFDQMRDDNISLMKENISLKKENIELKNKLTTIDFGVGKLYYSIEKEGSAYIPEIMDKLKEHAMLTPLSQILNKLK